MQLEKYRILFQQYKRPDGFGVACMTVRDIPSYTVVTREETESISWTSNLLVRG
jgi:hypothetical protein